MALVVAAVILLTIVLPAEYAIDPLGIGRRLGLTQMSAPRLTPVENLTGDGVALTPVQNGPVGQYPAEYKFDVVEIALEPYEYVEYKYHLEKGASMLYAWTATAPLIHDLHGEPDGGSGAEESFDKQDRKDAYGSLTAPFSGIHGWYWENPGGDAITIRLTSAGFYSSALEIRSDRTRRLRNLRPLETLSPLPDAAAATGAQQSRSSAGDLR
jgi:hypothetical protein